MNPNTKCKCGRVDLEVTTFAFGTALIGNSFREIDEQTSEAMYQSAWDAGVRYFDTAPPEIIDKVKKIEAVCWDHDVPLPTAALQFEAAHPAIPSFIAGIRNLAQLTQDLAWVSHQIPPEFWTDLKTKRVLHKDAPVPV